MQSLYPFFFFHFYVSFSHRPWSKVSILTFMSFSICEEVICFYAISLSIFFFTFMYHFRIDQGKYPYSYVFFKMQGSNMLLCNLSIHFFSLLCIISHRPWSMVSVRTFMSFSICKEVICFYAISLSNFFHFYVSFSHRPWSKISIRLCLFHFYVSFRINHGAR